MSIKNTRYNIMQAAQTLRQAVIDAQHTTNQIRINPQLSESYRKAQIDKAVGDFRAITLHYYTKMLSDKIQSAVKQTTAKLDALTATSDAQVQAAALMLAPVIQSATDNPDSLLRAYRRTYADHASRRLIEQTIESTLDVLQGLPRLRLAEGYTDAKRELYPTRSAEEIALSDDLDALAALEHYFTLNLEVATIDLQGMANGQKTDAYTSMTRTNKMFEIQQYENAVEAENTLAVAG